MELRKVPSRTNRSRAPYTVPASRNLTEFETNAVDTMDPKPCYIAECEYQTHARLTFDQQVMDIKAHAEIVHPPGNPSTQDTRPPREAVPKPKELPRPVVEEDITEGDWKHF